MSIREIKVPGILSLPTLNEMLRNVEELVYDRVLEVVKARRQSAVPTKRQ